MKKIKALIKRLRQHFKSSKRSKKSRPQSAFRVWLKRSVLRVIIWGGVLGVIALVVLFKTLPPIDDLNSFTKVPSILIKSEDGKIIGSFGDVYGDYIAFKAMPDSLVKAVVATEDRNFAHHFGIDVFGLIRATFANIRAGHVVQGGSTITQQVAKNVFLTPERSFIRKIKEMLLAFELEHRFSKEEILSIYLNRVYLGTGSYGVDAASRRYFGKSARELTLSESAIIAGLLKAPSRFAPTSNPSLSRQRAEQVLLNMKDAGYLTQAQVDSARKELEGTLGGQKHSTGSSLYFADWILDQLPEYIGKVEDDLVVTTTFQPELQALAGAAISGVMDKDGDRLKASQAALVAMTPDGAVRAMIGGRNYNASQYNRAVQALRQPGSSFKIFVYLAGLEAGYTPTTMVDDSPISIPIVGGTWYPKNYTNKFLGPLTLKEAVTNSVNTVAVQVSQAAGLDHVIEMAHRLGITSDIEEVPSIALGATEVNLLEMTTAYAHLAANGKIVYPYGILQIDNAAGETIYAREASPSSVVLRSDIVGMMNEMLKNVIDNGTGKAARIGRPAAGKTGTTSDYRDAWFMGFTPDLVTGVWVGNDDNTPMKKVTGGMLPAQIWHNFMQPALSATPTAEIPTTDVPSPLPWQPSITHGDERPPAVTAPPLAEPITSNDLPGEQAPTSPPANALQAQAGAKLGSGFWEKLGHAAPVQTPPPAPVAEPAPQEEEDAPREDE